MIVTILGTGFVGTTTAAIFAASGIKTYVIDKNPERLNSIRQGKAFFYEEGIDQLISDGINKGLLIPTEDYSEAVSKSNIIISAVGTPDNPDGSTNLKYIFAAAEEAAQYMKDGSIYAQKSTVPVGTGKRIQQLFDDLEIDVRYVSNPEFLREACAVFDTLWPDKVVVGGNNIDAIEEVMSLYKIIDDHRNNLTELAAINFPEKQIDQPYITMSLESAELTKVTSNAFLTTKISFANSIAILADKVGADVNEVMDAVGVDKRIGRAFLNAGRGFGGGCFPKDLSGLIASGLTYGVDLEILHAVKSVNEAMPGYVIEKLQDSLGGSLEDKKIAVLGLSFKAGTSDSRRSPGIAIANKLVKLGSEVIATDPHAIEEAKEYIDSKVKLQEDLRSTISGVHAIIITTAWPEYSALDLEEAKLLMHGNVVVDAMNCLNKEQVIKANLVHLGVGR